MIVIAAKFHIQPEDAENWPAIAADFTAATRAEPGCLWYNGSRSVDNPDEYVLIEAFRDAVAGYAHVQAAHFKAAQVDLPPHLVSTPLIINTTAAGETWSQLGELAVNNSIEYADGVGSGARTSRIVTPIWH